jgi:hypothetical protein
LASGSCSDRGIVSYLAVSVCFFDAVHVRRGCEASLEEVARKIALEHWNSSDFVFSLQTIKY